ncbi:MAG: NAD(P)-dependent oxidoreductase [Candidatus Omnitrophica bacterium]|nr:NAD(P)-dependent oxidoreductase [Candidatus Omnitrophota bacterium]
MPLKVIVFGGSGFLGSHVADSLTEQGHEVTIYDVHHSPYLNAGQKMQVADILDTEKVLTAIKGKDVVYNFSGLADLDSSLTRPIDTLRLNVEGTLNILEACRLEKVKRFIFASSIYVYSEKGGFYRCSKQAAETYIEEFQRKYGIDFTILRYGTLYGPRASETNSVYRYVKQALEKKRVTIAGDGEEIREYVHVKDAAQLSVDILAQQYQNKHLIITGHHPIKLKQLIATIEEMMGQKITIDCHPGTNPDHYTMTPYSYIPKIGQKITSNCYTDIGQGLLGCFQQISESLKK